MKPINAATVRNVLEQRTKQGIYKFTSLAVVEDMGLAVTDTHIKKAGSVICQLVRQVEAYRLNENDSSSREKYGFQRALRVYTTRLKDKAEENPTYTPPTQKAAEPEISYAEIGQAIIERMKDLEKQTKDLMARIQDQACDLEKAQNTICKLNETVTRQNQMLETSKGNSNGKFKLSEIARVNGHV
jgi:hypothetical protein